MVLPIQRQINRIAQLRRKTLTQSAALVADFRNSGEARREGRVPSLHATHRRRQVRRPQCAQTNHGACDAERSAWRIQSEPGLTCGRSATRDARSMNLDRVWHSSV